MPSLSTKRAVVLRSDFAATGFGAFGESAGRALGCVTFEALPDFVAGERPDFELTRLVEVFDAKGVVFRAAGLPDFLRVFLDIRLPFVAFRGPIIEVLRQYGSGRSSAGQFWPFRIMLKRISTRHPPAEMASAG